MKKIYWLQILQQCSDEPDIRVNIPNGLTLEQIADIERRINDKIDSYGEENDGDYAHFDYDEMLEKVLGDMGINYSYPPIEHTIYI